MKHSPPPRAVGLTAPERLSATLVEGELVLDALDAVIKRAQAYYRQFVPVDVSLADELIAERHAEAARD